MINRVRGTRDIINLELYDYIINLFKIHAKSFNFREIKTPILEYTSLFMHSLGESSDIISKEMYIFPREKNSKEESICLRPEMTSAMIRAYRENKISINPWKIFSIGEVFRHERPQKGRWREFTQLNLEIINSNSNIQDIILIKLLDSYFSDILKIKNYILRINYLGTKEDRENYKTILNKYIEKHYDKICDKCKVRKEKNILRVFDCKNNLCKKIYSDAPKLIDFISAQKKEEWNEIKEKLNLLSINFIEDSSLVRGLDYYNDIVFEFSSSELGAQDAFCGGGRYSLGRDMGLKNDVPSVGAAIGLGRLGMLLEKENKVPQEKNNLLLILPIGNPSSIDLSLLTLQYLHKKLKNTDINIDILNLTNSVSKSIKKANKLNATKVIIIGEDEIKNGMFTIKNMISSKQKTIKQSDLIQELIRL